MRKSTIARLMLLAYGINFITMFIGAITGNMLIAMFGGILSLFAWRWIEVNYFDMEENKNEM